MKYDTSVQQSVDPNDTSCNDGNKPLVPIDLPMPIYYHNRKVCRYAKKHHISKDEAFKRLYT